MYSTYVERSQPGLMYRQKPTEERAPRGLFFTVVQVAHRVFNRDQNLRDGQFI